MYKLKLMFYNMLRLANENRDSGYGDPCSYLMENMILYQASFLAGFENAKDTCCDSHEIRLNGAGLKLLWMKYNGRYWMDIAGDQKDLYPAFVKSAKALLREMGFMSINDQE